MTRDPDELLVDMIEREAAELETLLADDPTPGELEVARETAQRLARLMTAIALDGIAETARRMREREAGK